MSRQQLSTLAIPLILLVVVIVVLFSYQNDVAGAGIYYPFVQSTPYTNASDFFTGEQVLSLQTVSEGAGFRVRVLVNEPSTQNFFVAKTAYYTDNTGTWRSLMLQPLDPSQQTGAWSSTWIRGSAQGASPLLSIASYPATDPGYVAIYTCSEYSKTQAVGSETAMLASERERLNASFGVGDYKYFCGFKKFTTTGFDSDNWRLLGFIGESLSNSQPNLNASISYENDALVARFCSDQAFSAQPNIRYRWWGFNPAASTTACATQVYDLTNDQHSDLISGGCVDVPAASFLTKLEADCGFSIGTTINTRVRIDAPNVINESDEMGTASGADNTVNKQITRTVSCLGNECPNDAGACQASGTTGQYDGETHACLLGDWIACDAATHCSINGQDNAAFECYYTTQYEYLTSSPAEICHDNIDNNCDGSTDEGCEPITCDTSALATTDALELWLSPEGLSGTTGDALSNWPSCVGSYIATPLGNPMITTAPNAHLGVAADGDDSLSITNFAMSEGDMTLLAVINLDDVNKKRVFFDAFDQPDGMYLSYENGNKVGVGVKSSLYTSDVDPHATQEWVLVALTTKNGDVHYRINDEYYWVDLSLPSMNAFSGELHLLSRDGTGSFFEGELAELLVYDKFLSYDERTKTSRYLMNKYNIPCTSCTQFSKPLAGPISTPAPTCAISNTPTITPSSWTQSVIVNGLVGDASQDVFVLAEPAGGSFPNPLYKTSTGSSWSAIPIEGTSLYSDRAGNIFDVVLGVEDIAIKKKSANTWQNKGTLDFSEHGPADQRFFSISSTGSMFVGVGQPGDIGFLGRLYQSVDQGETWNLIDSQASTWYSVNARPVAIYQGLNNKLYQIKYDKTSSGTLYLREAIPGGTWTEQTIATNIQSSWYHKAKVVATSSGAVVVVTAVYEGGQNKLVVYRRATPSSSWSRVYEHPYKQQLGLIDLIIDHNNNIYFASSAVYEPTVFKRYLFTSRDGGQTWIETQIPYSPRGMLYSPQGHVYLYEHSSSSGRLHKYACQ